MTDPAPPDPARPACARRLLQRRVAADWPAAIASVLDHPDALRVVFQPVADLRRGRACGYEALARFGGPGPAAWFAAATRVGRRVELELLALDRALHERSRVRDGCFLSVNLSPETIVAPALRGVLAATGSLRGLVIEVVERAALADERQLVRALSALRERGARVAVDDVGAGYSGLRRVLALRPELMKLDRALVAGLDADPARRAAVRALRDFAMEVDAQLVAEGVERAEELEVLLGLGVPLAQGYFLGRPGTAMGAMTRVASREARAWAARADEATGVGRLVGVGLPPAGRHPRGPRSGGEIAPLVVGPGEAPAVVLRRAMARDARQRFAPVVVRDAGGAVLGFVAVECLVEAVTADGALLPGGVLV